MDHIKREFPKPQCWMCYGYGSSGKIVCGEFHCLDCGAITSPLWTPVGWTSTGWIRGRY